jgi:putative transposase
MPLQGSLSIERMCQLAVVSRASFYRYLQPREPELEEMEVRTAVQEVALQHRRRYGSRRIARVLQARGMRVGRKRVQAILRQDNLLALRRRKYVVTTESTQTAEV